jgi:hypothetical protein
MFLEFVWRLWRTSCAGLGFSDGTCGAALLLLFIVMVSVAHLRGLRGGMISGLIWEKVDMVVELCRPCCCGSL